MLRLLDKGHSNWSKNRIKSFLARVYNFLRQRKVLSTLTTEIPVSLPIFHHWMRSFFLFYQFTVKTKKLVIFVGLKIWFELTSFMSHNDHLCWRMSLRWHIWKLSLLKPERGVSNVLYVAHTSNESFMTRATSSSEFNWMENNWSKRCKVAFSRLGKWRSQRLKTADSGREIFFLV